MWLILLGAASALANEKIFRRLIVLVAVRWLVARPLEAFVDQSYFLARAAPVTKLRCCAQFFGPSSTAYPRYRGRHPPPSPKPTLGIGSLQRHVPSSNGSSTS